MVNSVMVQIEPNPETVEALLDTTWRTAASENIRTDGLDRKATALATLASIALSLAATAGSEVASVNAFSFAFYVIGLVQLVLALLLAVSALSPRKHLALGMTYLERFPKWGELLKTPTQVRAETMYGLIGAIARERLINLRKARELRWAFGFLVTGLLSLFGASSILGAGGL